MKTTTETAWVIEMTNGRYLGVTESLAYSTPVDRIEDASYFKYPVDIIGYFGNGGNPLRDECTRVLKVQVTKTTKVDILEE